MFLAGIFVLRRGQYFDCLLAANGGLFNMTGCFVVGSNCVIPGEVKGKSNESIWRNMSYGE